MLPFYTPRKHQKTVLKGYMGPLTRNELRLSTITEYLLGIKINGNIGAKSTETLIS